MKTIGEITKVGAGQSAPQDVSAFSNDGTPFVRAGSLEFLCKGASLNRLERINEQQAKIHKLKLYPSGTILFAKSGMSAVQNRVFVLPKPAHVVSHLATIEVKNGVDSKFLSYFWQNFKTSRLIQDPAYPSISLEAVGNVEIELPNLDEQKRIAAILDKADRLRRQCRFAQTLSDSFLQSVFIKMFGDPFVNEKGWEIKTIGQITKVKTGGTPDRTNDYFYGGNIPWVKTGEVVGEVICKTEEYLTMEGLKDSNCQLFPIGTLILAMYGQGLTRGRSGKLGIEATTNQACAAILPSNRINTDFLWLFLKVSYKHLRDLGRGGNQPNLNLEMVKNLQVPIPLIPLQEKFAEIVQKFERVRRQQREATRHATHLFQTLLHRAFRGEL